MVSFSSWITEKTTITESLDSSYEFQRDDLQGKPAYVFDQWIFEEEGTTYTVRFQNSEDFGKKVTQIRFGILSGRNLKLNIGKIKDIRKFTGTLFAIFEEALRNPTMRVANKGHGFLIVMPNKMFERVGVRGAKILSRRAKKMNPIMTVHDQYFEFYPQPSKNALFIWRSQKAFSDVFTQIPAVNDIPPASTDEEEAADQQGADDKDATVPDGSTAGVEIPRDSESVDQPAPEPEDTTDQAVAEPTDDSGDDSETDTTADNVPAADNDYSQGAEPIDDTEIMKKGLRAFVINAYIGMRGGESFGGPEAFTDESMKLTVEDFSIQKLFKKDHEDWIRENIPDENMVKLALIREGWYIPGMKRDYIGLVGKLASTEAINYVKGVDEESLEDLKNITFDDAQRILFNAESIAFNLGETYEIRKQNLKSFEVNRPPGMANRSTIGVKNALADYDSRESKERIVRRLIASESAENLETLPIMEDSETGYRTLSHKMPSGKMLAAKEMAELVYQQDLEGKEKAEFLNSLPPALQATVDGKRSENFEIFKTAFMDQWTMMHGSDAQKDANTAFTDFGANAQISSFWGHDPEREEEIPEHVLSHFETVYNKTQDFFRETVKNHENKTVKLYRGIGIKNVDRYIPGALESWSKQKSTANKFAKMMAPDPSDGGTILMAKVPYTAIWGTWESLKPEFPPEDHLKGKKEYIVMGGTFATTEIYVLDKGEDRVLPFVEWLELKEAEEQGKPVEIVDQEGAETDETTATGLDPAEEGLNKLTRKGKEYRNQEQDNGKNENN